MSLKSYMKTKQIINDIKQTWWMSRMAGGMGKTLQALGHFKLPTIKPELLETVKSSSFTLTN